MRRLYVLYVAVVMTISGLSSATVYQVRADRKPAGLQRLQNCHTAPCNLCTVTKHHLLLIRLETT